MNKQELDELLELKARSKPADDRYPSTEDFIARFRRRLWLRQVLPRLAVGIAAAAIMLLLIQAWHYSPSQNAAPETQTAQETDDYAEIDRLAEAERHFGKHIGVMFVNDNLLLFERQANGKPRYNVNIQLFSALGEPLASLEFASPGNDYIILEDEAITGRIFLNRCDDHDMVVELDLRLHDTRQRDITVNEIMATEQSQLIQNLPNGKRLRIDFSCRNS